MKNVFLTLVTIALFASCQKDYYLEDLEIANNKIERLTKANAKLNQQLNELQINLNNTLLELSNTNDLLVEANKNNENLTFDIETLEAQAVELNDKIVALTTQLNEELAKKESMAQTIEDLESDLEALELENDSLEDAIHEASDKVEELTSDLAYLEANPVIVEVVRVVTRTQVEYVVQVVEAEPIINNVENPLNAELQAQNALLEAQVNELENADPVVEIQVVEVALECENSVTQTIEGKYNYVAYDNCQNLEYTSIKVTTSKATFANKVIHMIKNTYYTVGETATVEVMNGSNLLYTYEVVMQ